jgi:hypothetical protein
MKEFGQAAADILFYVQEAAVLCLKPSANLPRTLRRLTERTSAQMVKAASEDLEATEAARAILAPLAARAGACAETERVLRRVERAWRRMRGLAEASSGARGQWKRLAKARDYSAVLQNAAHGGWLLSAFLSLGLLARRKTEEPALHVNLLVQNLVREARSEVRALEGRRPDEASWLRRRARALKALSPALLLLTLPPLLRRFLRPKREPADEPAAHGPDPKQAFWGLQEHGKRGRSSDR